MRCNPYLREEPFFLCNNDHRNNNDRNNQNGHHHIPIRRPPHPIPNLNSWSLLVDLVYPLNTCIPLHLSYNLPSQEQAL